MLKLYQPLIFPQVSEQKNVSYFLTEKHLQILWLEQKLIKNLKGSQGEKIHIISPGIWNKEAGPDFLKAHFRIDQREYRGDVEIHVDDEGWYQHGHHQDQRYNQVILHLSYWRSQRSFSINKENGQHPFSCYLEENLSISLPYLISLIDLDVYPTKQMFSKGRCSEQLFQLLPDNKIRNLLQSAAFWRLEKKLNELENSYCGNRTWQFAAGLAMALGYRHNAKAFCDLFFYLISYRDLAYEELLAIALGCCGFLEENRKFNWELSSYYQHLRLLWEGRKDQITHQASLKLNHIRPLHHPIRRLVYLTRLLQDPCLEQLWPHTLQLWERAMDSSILNVKQLQQSLLQVLPIYRDAYWDYHFTFESKGQIKSLPGLGKELKMHLLLNTLLPLFYAMMKESGNVKRWEKFQEFYARLETSQTSKSRYLHQRFFSFQKDEKFLAEAQMVQGAYQLHQDFCLHFETSCEGCPFVDRYQAQIDLSSHSI